MCENNCRHFQIPVVFSINRPTVDESDRVPLYRMKKQLYKKEKFSGFLHPTWSTMRQYFLRQAQHSSFKECQQLLAHEEHNANQNKTHEYLLVSSTVKISPHEPSRLSSSHHTILFLCILPNPALLYYHFYCVLGFFECWIIHSKVKP